ETSAVELRTIRTRARPVPMVSFRGSPPRRRSGVDETPRRALPAHRLVVGRQFPPERTGLVRPADGSTAGFRRHGDILLHAGTARHHAAPHQRAARAGVVRGVLRKDGGAIRTVAVVREPHVRAAAGGCAGIAYRMTRAFILVLDSLGVGGAPDAEAYGDAGADTFGHIAQRCASHDADRHGTRSGALHVPALAALGIGAACRAATGATPPGVDTTVWCSGL